MKRIRKFIVGLMVAGTSLLAADSAGLRKAPELAFTIPGQGQKLLSQYRGKVVAIEFVMTTCPHCQAAAKVMTKFQQEFGSRGFQALDLAINALDGGASEASADSLVSAFAANFQVGYPVGWIPREQMMAFMNFSIMDRMVVPQFILIDRKGYIHYQTPAGSGPEWEKVMNDSAVHQHIEELVSMSNAISARPAAKTVHVASSKKGI